MTMFERIVVGLLVLIIACLGAAFYTDWKLAVQVRSLKAFAEAAGHHAAAHCHEHRRVVMQRLAESRQKIVARCIVGCGTFDSSHTFWM